MGVCNRVSIKLKQAAVITMVIAVFIVLVFSTVKVAAASNESFVNTPDRIGYLAWSTNSPLPSKSILESATAPVCYGNSVFVASGDTLYRYNAKTGKLTGKADITPGPGRNKLAPTIADGKILISIKGTQATKASPGTNPAIAIVDANTMTVAKVEYVTNQIGYQSLTPVAYDPLNGCAYVGSFQVKSRKDEPGKVYGSYAKIDLSNSENLENIDVEIIQESEQGFYWSGACTEGDYVVFGSKSNGTDDSYTPATGNAVIYAMSKTTGNVGMCELPSSGSICSSVVHRDGFYYVVGKAGKLYKLNIIDDEYGVEINTVAVTALSTISTCTPQIQGNYAYVGTNGYINVINLSSMNISHTYKAPGDVKFLKVIDDEAGRHRVYATYNKWPGGIYEATSNKNYFIPANKMQQYCISDIAVDISGMMYYTNDSNYLMAIGMKSASFSKPIKLSAPKVSKKSKSKIKISWKAKDSVQKYQVAVSKYKSKKYSVTKTVSGKTKSITITAPRKKTRYYKVRAIKVVGSYTIYGDWSGPRKYKLK